LFFSKQRYFLQIYSAGLGHFILSFWTDVSYINKEIFMSKILIITEDKITFTSISNIALSSGLKNLHIISDQTDNTDIDLIIVDLSEETKPASDTVKELKQNYTGSFIIVIMNISQLLESAQLFDLGVVYIHLKNQDLNNLAEVVSRAIVLKNKSKELLSIRTGNQKLNEDFYKPYIFRSPIVLESLKEAQLVSENGDNVILLANTGVGKEIFAELIHRNSVRKNKKLIAINCAEISKDDAISALFGHREGAFTGAISDQIGFFEKANESTLFLDEIGDLEETVYAQLLRVLDSKTTIREFYKKGDKEITTVDVRIIAATNKVETNKYRKDFLPRFIWKIKIPDLKDRKEDLPDLVKYFIDERNKMQPQKNIVGVSKKVMDIFYKYEFTENIRGLRNFIIKAHAKCESNTIDVEDLDPELQNLL
jgi:DNA-binding NtrC family response regulator